jgi:hypothetical protein
MKKSILIIFVTTVLIAVTIFTGCQSPSEREASAEAKLQSAEIELEAAQKDETAQKAATAEEWELFKKETDLKIKKNEISIAELRIKISKPGTTFDGLYEKRINSIELKNKSLKARMESYEKSKSQSDWGKFKHEFNTDLDELGKALSDFTIENKK